MTAKNNLVGQRFSRLLVVGDGGRDKRKNVLWNCLCECGGTARVFAYDLRSGKVKSCGCYAKEAHYVKHGMSSRSTGRSPVYAVWAAMVQRCTNPKDRSWQHYGGRGITVCARWMTFTNFYTDMGEPPSGGSLDRRNNDEGYNPDNCYWATTAEQARNRRNNVWVLVRGLRLVLADACALLGINAGSVHYRRTTYQLTHQEAISYYDR